MFEYEGKKGKKQMTLMVEYMRWQRVSPMAKVQFKSPCCTNKVKKGSGLTKLIFPT